ncbi:hypothetical protein OG203_35255 [Nocardia sp. NBC_01499]
MHNVLVGFGIRIKMHFYDTLLTGNQLRAPLKTQRTNKDSACGAEIFYPVGKTPDSLLIDSLRRISLALDQHDPFITELYSFGIDFPLGTRLADQMLLALNPFESQLGSHLVQEKARNFFIVSPPAALLAHQLQFLPSEPC